MEFFQKKHNSLIKSIYRKKKKEDAKVKFTERTVLFKIKIKR